VSDLAFTCAMLELPINPSELYYTRDLLFLRWLSDLADRVASTRRSQQRKTHG